MPEAQEQDDRAVMICDPRRVDAAIYDITATYNNVAIAKHALLHGNTKLAMHRIEGALSWCAAVLDVIHPFMGDKTTEDELLILDLDGNSHPAYED